MSDDLYYKYGVLLEDDFFLATSTATAGVTGQAANFTLSLTKNGTAGQSTTGITITQATNTTTGVILYHLSCNATTSFVAATGEYSLVIQWNTDPNYSWTKTYRLTSNGLPPGTAGTASFTATANDGRITDWSTPLEDAQIFFNTPGGAPYVVTTSDATGLWGPVFFPSDGTWPFYVQLAGYSVASSSILVSGSTATGPGADIALTAIGAASGLTLSSLKTYARFQVRGNVGNAADQMIVYAINNALGELSRAFRWSWLKTDGDFITNAPYSTGTLTLTEDDATVTLSGGTWPAWAASGQLLIGGIYYRVATRTNGTTIELTTEYAGSTESGVGYTLYCDQYDMPADCMIFGKFFPCMGFGWKPDPISFESLREYQANNNFNAPNPGFIAVQNDKIILWPAPSTKRNWPATYYRRPATLVNNNDEADWDPLQLTLLQRAIDVQLAMQFGNCMHGDADTCLKHYEKSLSLAINNERENAQRTGIGRAPRNVTVADMTIPGAS